MTTPRRFLVVGLQRSGTSVTLAALAGHPEVLVPREEIHTALFAGVVAGTNHRGETAAARTASFGAVFDHVAGRREGAKAVGMKTALPTVAHTARMVACLAAHAPDLDLVVVHRQDLVAQFGSLRRALQLEVWHRRGDAPRPDAPAPVRLTDDELAHYVADCVACHRLVDTLRPGRRVLDLDYDADIATGQAWPRLFAFLGVAPLTPDWLGMQKVSPPPGDYIAEHARLAALLPLLRARAAAAPAPQPVADAADSRLFLLHRAQWLRHRGEASAALDDALAALDAPPDWGVETNDWACRTIGDLLFLLADRSRAAAVLGALEARRGDDAAIAQLCAAIRRHLGA